MKDAWPKQVRLLAVFSLIIFLLVGSSALLYNNFKEVAEQEFWVMHTDDVIGELNLTISAAKDAETGVRGYLLTHQAEYLEPFHQGEVEAYSHLKRVRSLTVDNSSQQEAITAVEATLKKRFDLFDELLKHGQNSKTLGKNEFSIAEGKAIMDSLKAQIEKMKTREEVLMAQRRESTDRSRSIFIWILFLTTAVTGVAITISFFQIGKNQDRAHRETQEKLQEANEKEMEAELSRIIAGDISFEKAGALVLQFLADHLGVLAGKIWAFDSQNRLSVVSSLGTTFDDKLTEQSGLAKAAVHRKDIWRVSNIPEEYWQISSGLGQAKPRELIFLPFGFQGRSIGVMELASFESATDEFIRYLNTFATTIGVGINAAQSRTVLQSLLEKTQQQAEELQTQQEELKTNNEELEQQARALESQQQALNIKNKELEERALELQRSSQYKSEFLAKMSHELRTPLNGLLILSTLLIENKEKNLTEQQKQFARSINNAGNDLLILISDILDLSKIEARKLSLRPEEFTLGELFELNKRTFEPQTLAKKLQLNMEVSPELKEFKIFSDRQRLDQILRNFLSNAIKFTDQGAVSMSAKLNPTRDVVTLTVSDSGIGIPKNKQQSIFEAFEQADSSVSRKYGGTGLGLTISRELAALLGGKITVMSEEGKGSEFSVQIPVKVSKPGSPVAFADGSDGVTEVMRSPLTIQDLHQIQDDHIHHSVEQALKNIPKDKKTILIVEDDPSFRASIVEAVKAYGFAAIEAGDGDVALAIVNEHSPDAILLDIKLPGISGLGILEMIKQIPHLRHIPVHMISALDYQHNALRMGALGYLTKPVTIEKVRSALGRIENMISKKLRRVLLIEDDERQNEAISQLISGTDLEVISASTGKAAVAHLKKQGFDCIILDLTLPDVSGFDLLSELRALEISLPPVVIYTGKDLSDEEERYLRKYSESIVIKGARSPERLLDEVNLFLHRVESLLPEAKREMLTHMRSQERNFEGKTILIADDDIRNVFALTSALESRNLQTRVARDGIEAIEMLEKHPDIDLVLMDIMMPRMDGFEAMRKIRHHDSPQLRQIPIVALTAKAMKDDHEKCIEAGANDYLPKPVNLDNLSTVLKVWLAPKGFLA